ncbi:uncharacterized protein LOC126727945 [Quercus robur]|uniref:uncharacterized protein LOC126727945 n=1 Tax=Quercus robur TaxID=38942 RepID=UPI00216382E0|nr:uncharacterized protein LOC126727945 [Quercus robur]
MRASHDKKSSRQPKKNKNSPTKNPSRTHALSNIASFTASFKLRKNLLHAEPPQPARTLAGSQPPQPPSSLPSCRTSTTATQIAGSRHSSVSSLPSRRTSTTATQIAGAERFRRRRVRRSLETNQSRRELRSKGLVVSTCLGGALVRALLSGCIADGVGRRRAFQLCALPMIVGASMRCLSDKFTYCGY